jgi:hypothetical protein
MHATDYAAPRISPKIGATSEPVQFWLQGHTMIGPDRVRGGNGLLNFWRYPAGGWPKKIIRRPDHAIRLFGVTISKTGQHSPRAIHRQELRPEATALWKFAATARARTRAYLNIHLIYTSVEGSQRVAV